MDRPEVWDCVVIGAGPAGSTAAAEVARGGHRCLILEKGTAPGTQVACGGGMPVALARKLQLEGSVVDRTIDEILMVADGGRPCLARYGKPVLAAVQRPVLDRLLADRAVAAGATLDCCAKVIRIIPGDPMQVVVVRDPSGGERNVASRVVIAADGPATIALRDLGIGFDPSRQPCAYALKYRVRYEPALRNRFDFVFNRTLLPFGYFWIFPKRDYVNIGIGALSRASRGELDSLLKQFAATAGIDWDKAVILERRGGLVPLQPARKWVAGRCLVVGDAAGLVNPLTGGGLVYAIRSGEIAGTAVSRALNKGNVSVRALKIRYPLRFVFTPHFWWLRFMLFLLKAAWSVRRLWPSAYITLFQSQFRFQPLFARIKSI